MEIITPNIVAELKLKRSNIFLKNNKPNQQSKIAASPIAYC